MTSILLFAGIVRAVYGLLLFLTSLVLILLVLIQRGRGGGLSGAFGGMGGQSAFGAKAGDTFTHITIWAAGFWIVLCLIGVKWMGSNGMPSKMADVGVTAEPLATDAPGGTAPAVPGGSSAPASEAPASEAPASDDAGDSSNE